MSSIEYYYDYNLLLGNSLSAPCTLNLLLEERHSWFPCFVASAKDPMNWMQPRLSYINPERAKFASVAGDIARDERAAIRRDLDHLSWGTNILPGMFIITQRRASE
jgi:hypothetical protein